MEEVQEEDVIIEEVPKEAAERVPGSLEPFVQKSHRASLALFAHFSGQTRQATETTTAGAVTSRGFGASHSCSFPQVA